MRKKKSKKRKFEEDKIETEKITRQENTVATEQTQKNETQDWKKWRDKKPENNKTKNNKNNNKSNTTKTEIKTTMKLEVKLKQPKIADIFRSKPRNQPSLSSTPSTSDSPSTPRGNPDHNSSLKESCAGVPPMQFCSSVDKLHEGDLGEVAQGMDSNLTTPVGRKSTDNKIEKETTKLKK